MSAPRFPRLGTGIGLRTVHYPHILEHLPRVDWFEAISENYMGLMRGGRGTLLGIAGRPIRILERIRRDYPVVLHGVSLSIGSTDPLNRKYLTRLRELIRRVEPALVSDHLCWTGVEGENLHDLLPIPYTGEALDHVVSRVARVQDFLGRRILLENVSTYLTYTHSEMPEWEFLAEVARRADCGILLDVNNIHVSAVNHGFDPVRFLVGIPVDRVGQFHLAGYSDLGDHLIDTHGHPVSKPVWALYEKAVRRFGAVSTLIEWDDRIPPFPRLEAEARKAKKIQEKVNGTTKEKRNPGPTAARSAALAALDSH